MVFIYTYDAGFVFGIITARDTSQNTSLLILESVFGLVVAISNMLIILTFFVGWKKLMKSNFYIILVNLVACTSLKAFVELGFIVPYYVMQSNELKQHGYFSGRYEYLVFNVSVFADYGVLFFSMFIAIDRFILVKRTSSDVIASLFFQRLSQVLIRLKMIICCCTVWLITAVIPALFFVLECQYVYQQKLKLYRNTCNNAGIGILWTLLNCLIYLTYACAGIVLMIYLMIIQSLRRQRSVHSQPGKAYISNVQMQLLKQSGLVFTLYAVNTLTFNRIRGTLIYASQTSIFCVLAMTAVAPGKIFDHFLIAYIENLLNLSIAAIYPICFLAMSGEMKRILILKMIPRGSWAISSVRHSSNNIRPARNEIT
ncbi:hypothetical protein PRIPAC_79553 [Pristionchus pacificus]|uniref:G_PROTEIN_RECEP_F1_2 domain-containing protein n=1 Tax=Pristionchus pacificus TaxID=54126 RepID=A0A2A6CKM3_PRIPA|nr:hypothetical protein PRIPAC_79553 [Pristionchus pacificus]|eukprot:PDM78627.1 hypothetical protein PRIPAC_31206 [Pristionchus pacificus]